MRNLPVNRKIKYIMYMISTIHKNLNASTLEEPGPKAEILILISELEFGVTRVTKVNNNRVAAMTLY